MANTRQKYLFFSPSTKKLYQRLPIGGNWWEFQPQPEVDTAANMCVGLPDGSIVVCDANPARAALVEGTDTLLDIASSGDYWQPCFDGDDTLYIGDPTYSSNLGRVLRYDRVGSTWSLGYTISNPDGGYGFGSTVSASRGTVAIGAPFKTVDGYTNNGTVHIYTNRGETYQQECCPSYKKTNNYIGWKDRLCLDGNGIVIGTPNRTTGPGWVVGGLSYWSRTSGVWTETVIPSPETGHDYFGEMVTFDEGTMTIIGSRNDQKLMRVYRYTGSWVLSQSIASEDSSHQARNMAIAGNVFVWWQFHPWDHVDVMIYTQQAGSWQPTASFVEPYLTDGVARGRYVAVNDSDVVVFGCPVAPRGINIYTCVDSVWSKELFIPTQLVVTGPDACVAISPGSMADQLYVAGAHINTASGNDVEIYNVTGGPQRKMLHYDPVSKTWINRGHPGGVNAWKCAVAVGESSAVAVSDGHVATFDGGTNTWSYLANRNFSPMDVAAPSLTDIWVAGGSPGSEKLERYYGGSWIDMRAQMVSNLGMDPGQCRGICNVGNDIYLACFVETPTSYLVKYTSATSTFSLLGTVSSRRLTSVWAEDASNVYLIGAMLTSYWYTYIYKYNGTSLSSYLSLSYTQEAAPVKQLIGVSATQAIACIFDRYYTPNRQYLYACNGGSFGGFNFAYDVTVGQLAILWQDEHIKEVEPQVTTMAVAELMFGRLFLPSPPTTEVLALAMTDAEGCTVYQRNTDRWRQMPTQPTRDSSQNFEGKISANCPLLMTSPDGNVVVYSYGSTGTPYDEFTINQSPVNSADTRGVFFEDHGASHRYDYRAGGSTVVQVQHVDVYGRSNGGWQRDREVLNPRTGATGYNASEDFAYGGLSMTTDGTLACLSPDAWRQHCSDLEVLAPLDMTWLDDGEEFDLGDPSSVVLRLVDNWDPLGLYIGTPDYNDGEGRAYLFVVADGQTEWTLRRIYSNPDGPDAKTRFGHTIDIITGWLFSYSADKVIIGAPYRTVDGHPNAGAIFWYQDSDGEGHHPEIPKAMLTATEPEDNAYLGYNQRTGLFGDYIVAGDALHSKVHTWKISGGVYSETDVLSTACNYVSATGGGTHTSPLAVADQHDVRVYNRSGTTWALSNTLNICSGEDEAIQGFALDGWWTNIVAYYTVGTSENRLVMIDYDEYDGPVPREVTGLPYGPDDGHVRVAIVPYAYDAPLAVVTAAYGEPTTGCVDVYSLTSYGTCESVFTCEPETPISQFGAIVSLTTYTHNKGDLGILGSCPVNQSGNDMVVWSAWLAATRGCIDVFTGYGAVHEQTLILPLVDAEAGYNMYRLVGLYDDVLMAICAKGTSEGDARELRIYTRAGNEWSYAQTVAEGSPAWMYSAYQYPAWLYPAWRGGNWIVSCKGGSTTTFSIVAVDTWSVVYTATDTSGYYWQSIDLYGNVAAAIESKSSSPYGYNVKIFEYADGVWGEVASFYRTGSFNALRIAVAANGSVVQTEGSYLHVYQKRDGVWTFTHRISTTSGGWPAIDGTRIMYCVGYYQKFYDISDEPRIGFYHYIPSDDEWQFNPFNNTGTGAETSVNWLMRGSMESEDLAYTLDYSGGPRVLKWNGERWAFFAYIVDYMDDSDDQGYSIWSCDGYIYVVGLNAVARYNGAEWSNIAGSVVADIPQMGDWNYFVDVFGTANDDVYILVCTYLWEEGVIDRYATCVCHWNGSNWALLGELANQPANEGYSYGEMQFNGANDIWVFTFPDDWMHAFHWNGSSWTDTHSFEEDDMDWWDYNRYFATKGAYAVSGETYLTPPKETENAADWTAASWPDTYGLRVQYWAVARFQVTAAILLNVILPLAYSAGQIAAVRFATDSSYDGVQVLPADGSGDTINGASSKVLTGPGETATFAVTEYGKWGIVMRYKP